MRQDLEPSPQTRAILLSLYQNEQYDQAEAMAQMLAKQFPKHGFAWKVWGASLKKLGRINEALAPMQKSVALAPNDYQAYNNLGVALKDLGRLDHAVTNYRQALKLRPDFGEAHGNLGEALREQGKLADALASYKRKLQLIPDDFETQHLVAALSGQHTQRAPAQYVQGVFNNYAATFDSHLQQALQYDVPKQLAAMARQHVSTPAGQWRALDLGCGTGLVGEAIASDAGLLVGVDLANKMLQKAQAKQIYQRLECADIVSMMEAEPAAHYDLVLAADVFIYVGQLDDVFAQVKRVLTPGGCLLFSIEQGQDGTPHGYQLLQSGRYAHTLAYVRQLADQHGLIEAEQMPTQIRMDNRQPIAGHLMALRA